MTRSDIDKSLIDAVNLLQDFADNNLPAGYQIVLSFGKEDADLQIFTPTGDELEFQPDSSVASFRMACLDCVEDHSTSV